LTLAVPGLLGPALSGGLPRTLAGLSVLVPTLSLSGHALASLLTVRLLVAATLLGLLAAVSVCLAVLLRLLTPMLL